MDIGIDTHTDTDTDKDTDMNMNTDSDLDMGTTHVGCQVSFLSLAIGQILPETSYFWAQFYEDDICIYFQDPMYFRGTQSTSKSVVILNPSVVPCHRTFVNMSVEYTYV